MSHFKNKLKQKLARYFRRKHRVNVTIKSTNPEMRVIVNKSNKYVSAQAIAGD
jgi:ribosomal protein L18